MRGAPRAARNWRHGSCSLSNARCSADMEAKPDSWQAYIAIHLRTPVEDRSDRLPSLVRIRQSSWTFSRSAFGRESTVIARYGGESEAWGQEKGGGWSGRVIRKADKRHGTVHAFALVTTVQCLRASHLE